MPGISKLKSRNFRKFESSHFKIRHFVTGPTREFWTPAVSNSIYFAVIIDWGAYSFGEYFSVIPRFTQISKTIAKLLVDLFERGLDINQLHCVGL